MKTQLIIRCPSFLGLSIKKMAGKPMTSRIITPAVNNGEKHLVDIIRQPDGKSLGILE